MSMTPGGFYGSGKPEHEIIDLIRYAVSTGITFLDTSDRYGPHLNEILVGKAIKGIRDKVQLATKFGVGFDHDGKPFIRGDPEYVRAACEASLKRLDVDCIDLYYQHRIDQRVPIEITVGAMKKLVEEGKVKYLGLSEASASTIRRAHAVHPITCVQMEWSLWSRDIEKEIVPTCRELGIGIVAYSPLGRGFLSAGAKLLESLPSHDYRKSGQPRLQGEHLEKNKALYESLQELARRKECTPGQLALAWVQGQGNDVVPIPGTTKVRNFEENVRATGVKLASIDMKELEGLFPPNAASGDRYLDHSALYDSVETPPLSSWKNY